MVFILNNNRRIIYDDDMITMRMFEVTLCTDAELAVWSLRADIWLGLWCMVWHVNGMNERMADKEIFWLIEYWCKLKSHMVMVMSCFRVYTCLVVYPSQAISFTTFFFIHSNTLHQIRIRCMWAWAHILMDMNRQWGVGLDEDKLK